MREHMKNLFDLIPSGLRTPFLFDTRSSARERELVVQAFGSSGTEAYIALRFDVYKILQRLIRRRKNPFGMLVVLGWKKEWLEEFASFPDSTQNLFAKKSYALRTHSFERTLELFTELSYFDGAVLMNPRGEMIASGVYVENIHPKEVAQEIAPAKAEDLSEAFGFMKKVHTRHLTGIACSHVLQGTTVYAISEEHEALRIFEKGKIIYSTIRSEIASR